MEFAIAVGCQKYEDPQIASLKYAEGDAKRFADALVQNCDIEADNLVVLSTDANVARSRKQPTRSSILRSLSPPNNIGEIQTLYFYFSGHGIESSRDREAYILPSDCFYGDIETTAISVRQLLERLRAWQASTTILFLDVCRSVFDLGKSGLAFRSIDKRAMEEAALPGFAVFWSCSPGQSSFECEDPEIMSGVFTHSLCSALSPLSSVRTIDDLRRFLEHDTARICQAYQTASQNQRPYVVVEPLEVKDRYLVSISRLRQRAGPLSMLKARERPTPRLANKFNVDDFLPLWCGFDFGTSHSACAVCDRSVNVTLVPMRSGGLLLPSTLEVSNDFQYQVGALAPEDESHYFLRGVKRLLGQKAPVMIHNVSFRPEELVSLIVRAMKDEVEAYFGRPIERAIISAPTRFTVRQCESLLEAFHLAGVPVYRLIAEPAAASVVVSERELSTMFEDKLVMVVDLGGGTLDVAILEYGDGLCEIKASSGDRTLGGMDYDELLASHLIATARRLSEGLGVEVVGFPGHSVTSEAEKVKKLLSTREEATALFDIESRYGIRSVEVPVTRREFREICGPLCARIKACIAAAFDAADLPEDSIDSIVLAGLGAKIFTVRELLSTRFPSVTIEERFQETAVCNGLGIYTGVLKGLDCKQLLLDALPTQIALRCHSETSQFALLHTSPGENKELAVLAQRDATIPTRRTVRFKVIGAPVENATIYFVEDGKHVLPEEADLGSLTVPSSVRAGDLIEVTLDIDASRTIRADVVHMAFLRTKDFQLSRSFGISRPTDLGIRPTPLTIDTVFPAGSRNVLGPTYAGTSLMHIVVPPSEPVEFEIFDYFETSIDTPLAVVQVELASKEEDLMLSLELEDSPSGEALVGALRVFGRGFLADVQLNNSFTVPRWAAAD